MLRQKTSGVPAAFVTSHGIRTAWLLMVMPRSRSMSIRSRYCALIARSSTTPVSWSIRSASVDLPWSMWAMMQKFRTTSGGVDPGAGPVGPAPDRVGGTVDVLTGRSGFGAARPRRRAPRRPWSHGGPAYHRDVLRRLLGVLRRPRRTARRPHPYGGVPAPAG